MFKFGIWTLHSQLGENYSGTWFILHVPDMQNRHFWVSSHMTCSTDSQGIQSHKAQMLHMDIKSQVG